MFKIIGEGGYEKVIKEGDEALVLGRNADSITNAQVSRTQVSLRVEQGRLLMRVSGPNPSSHNGLLVRKGDSVELQDGDECRVLESPCVFPFSVARVEIPKRPRKEPCKYGASCYQKNPDHLERFSHPGRDDDSPSDAFVQPVAKKQVVSASAPSASAGKQTAPPPPAKQSVSPPPPVKSVPPSKPPTGASGGGGGGGVPSGSTVFTFGKYQGKTFEYVLMNESGYCKWALNLDEPSAQIVPFVEYLRGTKKPSSPSKSPSKPSDNGNTGTRDEALAEEWKSMMDVVHPASKVVLDPVAQPYRPVFGGKQKSLSSAASLASSDSSLAAVLALPLLGVNEALRVDPKMGLRVCAEAVNAFLVSRPDAELTLAIAVPSAELRDALTKLLRDRSRARIVAANGLAELSSKLGQNGPSFAALEVSWRMAVVPKSGFADIVQFVGAGAATGKAELMAKMKSALTEAGLSGVGELGRAYAVGPLDRAMFSAGGRAAVPQLKFLVAARVPNCNPALEDAKEDAAEAEALLRSAWDATLDAFWRAYQKYCD